MTRALSQAIVNQKNGWHVVVAANAAALQSALHLAKMKKVLKKKNLDSGLASISDTLAPLAYIVAKDRTNILKRMVLFMLEIVVVGLRVQNSKDKIALKDLYIH